MNPLITEIDTLATVLMKRHSVDRLIANGMIAGLVLFMIKQESKAYFENIIKLARKAKTK